MATTRTLKAVLEAQDRASPVFRRVAGAVTALGAVAAAVGAVQIGRKLVGGIQQAVEASAFQEAQERKLQSALALTGQLSGDLFNKLAAQASALQAVTDVGDETVLQIQALLVQFGVGVDKVSAFSEATIDLAKTFKIDYLSAANLVAKAVSGNVGALGRYGVQINKTKLETEGAVAVLEALQKQFGGRARAEVDTYEGALQQLENSVGDLKEALGEPFRDVFRGVAQVLRPTIDNIIEAVSKNKAWRDAVFDVAIALAELGAAIEQFVKQPVIQEAAAAGFELLLDGMKKVATATDGTIRLMTVLAAVADGDPIKAAAIGMNAAQGATADLNLEMSKLAERLRELKAAGDEAGAGLRNNLTNLVSPQDQDRAEKVFAPMVDAMTDAILLADALGQANTKTFEPYVNVVPDVLDPLIERLEGMRIEVISMGDAVNILVSQGVEGLQNELKKSNLAVAGLGTELKKSLGTVGVNAALTLGDTLVEAAFGADVSFREFFKQLLKDLAKAIAQALILRAILSAFGGFGFNVGGTASAGSSVTTTGFAPTGGGGFASLQSGGSVVGIGGPQIGRDRIPAVLQPGETVIDRSLTEALRSQVLGQGQVIRVELSSDLPLLVDRINDGARDGSIQIVSTDFAGPRSIR